MSRLYTNNLYNRPIFEVNFATGRRFFSFFFTVMIILLLSSSGCQLSQPTPQMLTITIIVDGKTQQLSLNPSSTVQDALTKANITLEKSDRVEPILSTVISSNGMTIKVIRVLEKFEIKEVTIPFERQVARNESMPLSETMLVQPGANGTQEITYRYLYDDGVEISKTIVKSVIVKEAVPEISMVGVLAPFAARPIPGRLVYLIAGNAWMMEKTTGTRRPLVSSGDLDGHIFCLSPDGGWLLFTRKPEKPSTDIINSLWVVNTSLEGAQPIDLKAKNIINFAGWIPEQSQGVSYSTVEPRTTAPGWQANNDLQTLTFSSSGQVKQGSEIISANSGGIYGWWGTTFAWSPDGKQLAYARPDSIGLVDIKKGGFQPLLELIPFQTHGDWAWVPGINWSPDGKILFTVTHVPDPGQGTDEESPLFDVSAILLSSDILINLVPQSGMFSFPMPSSGITQTGYQLAYLQAIFSDQSDTSRYRLMVMDRDGSNRTVIFPPEGSTGLDAHQVSWSPVDVDGSPGSIAVIYQGNLWLVDADGKTSNQITGDGLITNIDWK